MRRTMTEKFFADPVACWPGSAEKIMKSDIVKALESCCAEGTFSPLDLHFARFMGRLAGDDSPELLLAAALASRRTGTGHSCFELAETAGKALPQTPLSCPELAAWTAALAASPVVSSGSGSPCPLVLDGSGRLYLYRYWLYEKNLAEFFLRQAAADIAYDGQLLQALLARLFPAKPGQEPNRQRLAAFAAATRRCAVICGGPGTGKTTTVAGILALLIGLADRPLRIALAAPTGKAADRVQQAIGAALQGLGCDAAIKEGIPREAATLHRLLGLSADEARPRFDANTPLPYDVVVIDEASMVDLPILAKLARALEPEARLILLGDKDQLASVESGAVLGDLCAGGRAEIFSRGHLQAYESITGDCSSGLPAQEQAPPLADCIVELKDNYRFGAAGGIGALAGAVKNGDSAAALAILGSGSCPELAWQQGRGAPGLEKTALESYGGPCRCTDAARALDLFARFRILCAVREGPRGVAGVNSAVEAALEHHRLIRRTGPWYHGRPIMVTRNDYAIRVFNGDIGMLFRDETGAMKACFSRPDGSQRSLAPARLPEHETAFALTVHKSQGSEFQDVLVVLPDVQSPVLTRELLYTAITRTRATLTLLASADVLAAAVERCISRTSGLRDALAKG
jgi:exodeoxyribonuclease V alpha subunit